MEIRTMRCCMCPNEKDSYLCKPPQGWNTPEKQCNFVLDFRHNLFTEIVFRVKSLYDGYAIVAERDGDFASILSPKYDTRDVAQKKLNEIAFMNGYEPIIHKPTQEVTNENKKCLFCQGTKSIVFSKGKKGFDIFIDNDYLFYAYFDDDKQAGGSSAKKIAFCPICGRNLIPQENETNKR